MPEEITVRATGDRENIDDETVAYILPAQKYFEDLRQVAAQLAGLLVLAAAGSKSAPPDHPMLEVAKQLHKSATAGIRGLRATERASAHRDYLCVKHSQEVQQREIDEHVQHHRPSRWAGRDD